MGQRNNVTRSRYNRIRMAKPHTLCLTPTHIYIRTHKCVNYGYFNYKCRNAGNARRLATRTHLVKRSAPTILASFLFVAEPAAWPQPPLDLSHFNFHSPIPFPFPDLTTDSHIYERFMPKANFMEKRIVLASLLPVCMCLLICACLCVCVYVHFEVKQKQLAIKLQMAGLEL